MLNWLSSDEDLISIRPKEPEDRPLNMNSRQMTMMFYFERAHDPAVNGAGGRGSLVAAEVGP